MSGAYISVESTLELHSSPKPYHGLSLSRLVFQVEVLLCQTSAVKDRVTNQQLQTGAVVLDVGSTGQVNVSAYVTPYEVLFQHNHKETLLYGMH